MSETALLEAPEDPGAPSVNALIADSIGAPESTGKTALDDVRHNVRGALEAEQLEAPVRHGRGPGRKRDRNRKHRRTRPLPGSPDAPPAESADSEKPTRAPLKAELALKLEEREREIQALRARSDVDKIGELARTLEACAVVGFGLVAEVRGPHWALSSEESKSIGSTSAIALAPHAERLNQNLPWLAAVTTLGVALFKRVQIDRSRVRALEVQTS